MKKLKSEAKRVDLSVEELIIKKAKGAMKMIKHFHPACEDCVQNGSCLLQDHGDVEDCQDVQQYNEKMEEDDNNHPNLKGAQT